MKIAIGSDHRGVEQRKSIAKAIEAAGHTAVDRGTFSSESCDYPDIARDVAQEVSSGRCDGGVLLCGTGIGVSIAANKVSGIRAAVCCNVDMARLSRQHNNANVLCLSGEKHSETEYFELVDTWLNSEFEGGRHARRVDKIMQIEN